MLGTPRVMGWEPHWSERLRVWLLVWWWATACRPAQWEHGWWDPLLEPEWAHLWVPHCWGKHWVLHLVMRWGLLWGCRCWVPA